MADRNNPVANNKFTVEINGIQDVEFTDVEGLDDETQTMEHSEGGDNSIRTLSAGKTKYGPVTLKGAHKKSQAIAEWRKKIRDGEEDYRDVIITLRNAKGDKVTAWRITDAWPSKYTRTTLNAKGTDPAGWTLVLQVAGEIEDNV